MKETVWQTRCKRLGDIKTYLTEIWGSRKEFNERTGPEVGDRFNSFRIGYNSGPSGHRNKESKFLVHLPSFLGRCNKLLPLT
jgi:hypothetical protein